MRECSCHVCRADRWAHRLIGIVAGLALVWLLAGIVVRATPPSAPESPLWGFTRGDLAQERREAPLDPPSVAATTTGDARLVGASTSPAAVVGQPTASAASVPGLPLAGVATWFAAPAGTAAAGPVLRAALGPSWRGRVVTVCADACISVRLDDWCACGERGGRPTLLDLSASDFARLAPLSVGVLSVKIGA